jgi:lysozyme
MNIQPRIVVAALSLSAVAFGGLVAYEGYSDSAIIPIPGDVPTVGFGTTEGVKMGDRITPPKAVQRALQDVAKFEGAVKQCVTVPLHQFEYDAYISLSYNIGPGAFCGSTLVRKLNAGDYSGACREILRWDRAQGRVVRGLTIRRQSEYQRCIGAA